MKFHRRVLISLSNMSRFRKSLSTATKGKTDIVGALVFSGISCFTLGLGIWQWKRYEWKVELIKNNRLHVQMEPIVISKNTCSNTDEIIKLIKDNKGRLIKLEGTYNHENELLLGPRSNPNSSSTSAQGMSSNPQGYFVVVPLVTTDGATVIMNRGWIPMKMMKTGEWRKPQGVQTLNVVSSSFEKGSMFSPINDLNNRKLLWLEEESLIKLVSLNSKNLKTSIAYVEDVHLEDKIDSRNSLVEYPMKRSMNHATEQTIMPMTHLVYSITWFCLAISGFFMTYSKFKQPKSIVNKFRNVSK